MILALMIFAVWLVTVIGICAFFYGVNPKHKDIVNIIRRGVPLVLVVFFATLLCGCRYISTVSTRYAESEFLDPVTEQPPEFKNE